jgi:hypothetical protein
MVSEWRQSHRQNRKLMRCVVTNIGLFVILITGCSNRSGTTGKTAASVAVADIAAAYTSYHKVTDSEVYVNPELAMLCVGAGREQLENARTRHGPHANTAILVYMNEPAAQVFSRGDDAYPVGSVIVKHKSIHGYGDQKSGEKVPSAENGAGGMVKRAPGYDSAHGDWEYFYFEHISNIQSGRIQSCVQCHEGAKDKDYVFGTWRTTPPVSVSAHQ